MTGAYSFLFDSSDPAAPTWYGGRFDSAFLAALNSADPLDGEHSWLLRGDLMIKQLAVEISSVESSERRSSFTQSYNRDVIKTVIFDFLEWVSQPPSRFEADRMTRTLLSGHVAHCVTAVSISHDVALDIDTALTGEPLYLGMAAIDLGNPMMTKLLIDFLVNDAGVSKGQIWLEADFDGDVHTLFGGAEQFSDKGEGVLNYGGLAKKFGPIPSAPLSEPGKLAIERYQQKSKLSLQGRVLSQLAYDWDLRGEVFRFDAIPEDRLFDLEVPPPKLTAYALNPDHPEGAGKAKFFSEVLHIYATDWQFLMAQIHETMVDAEILELKVKRWDGGVGVSFNAVIPIMGRNNRVATVLTNWIMEQGQPPRLSTIIPIDHPEMSLQAMALPVIELGLTGDDKWSAIHKLASAAGEKAHDNEVPTPLFVNGFGGHTDGDCGWAYVTVPDARKDFARWLVKTGAGDKGYKGGATIRFSSETQSVDRAYAAASAYARVLEYHGIAYTLERLLD